MTSRIVLAPLCALALLANNGSCDETQSSADRNQAQATAQMAAQADATVGMPRITNWTEKKLVKDIYERRDRTDLSTFAYVQGMDGRLRCLGRAVGYGVPYSAQYSNPQRIADSYSQGGFAILPQPEPNGLFTPDGLSATWLQLLDPATGKVNVVYIEPPITVSPFRLSGPAVAADCP